VSTAVSRLLRLHSGHVKGGVAFECFSTCRVPDGHKIINAGRGETRSSDDRQVVLADYPYPLPSSPGVLRPGTDAESKERIW